MLTLIKAVLMFLEYLSTLGCVYLFLTNFFAVKRFGDDWKTYLELPSKDNRIKTSVRKQSAYLNNKATIDMCILFLQWLKIIAL